MHKQINAVAPIETTYKGYRFRSRLEARWAIFYDKIGINWEYETDRVPTDAGHYLPDFTIHTEAGKFYHEVKPAYRMSEFALQSVYMAGKMDARHDYRPQPDRRAIDEWSAEEEPEPVNMLVDGVQFKYVGPFSYLGGHGSDDDLHAGNVIPESTLLTRCMNGIKSCSLFCIHLDTADAHGSIAEMGYASAMGIPISLTISKWIAGRNVSGRSTDFWFIEGLADKVTYVGGPAEATDAHIEFIRSHTAPEMLKLMGSMKFADGVFMTFGDPYDGKFLGFKKNIIQPLIKNHPEAAQYARSYRFDRN